MKLQADGYFRLDESDFPRCLCVDAPGSDHDRADIFCTLNPGHARKGPRRAELDVIVPCSPPPDVLFSWGQCLPQAHVIEALQKEGVTGFATRGARAVIRKTQEPVSVRELVVTGCGGVLPTWTGVELDEKCPECRSEHYSGFTGDLALIDLEDWDGSDVFTIWPMPAFIFVTRKVRNLFTRFGFRGVRFTREFPRGGDGFSVVRGLSERMPGAGLKAPDPSRK